MNAIKILCLEDQPEDYDLINIVLNKGGIEFVSERVDTQTEYVRAINEFLPDIILSDHALPQFNSFEALQICLDQKRVIPFILVTGAVSEEFAVDCLKHGAKDYVLKSNLSRLPISVKSALKHKDLEQSKHEAALQMERQNEDLVKINSELDSFVYSVSHNLRAPLRSVLGLINLTKDEQNVETIHDYNRKMEIMINKLDETLKEILDYSRNARQDKLTERVDLKKAIQENLEKLKYMPGFERVEVKLTVNRSTVFMTDAYRVAVILNNMISNAIKYQDFSKEKSFLHIQVAIKSDVATLHFHDNGIGIEPSVIDKIFNMFYRATDRSDGSGLGLYIVKEAVEKLNGKISVESKPGEGTLFRIELPNHLL